MGSNPPRALSDNTLTLTLTQGGAAVTTAVTVVTVVSPAGVTTMSLQSVPHIGNGAYQYTAGPAVWPTDGTYTLTWNAVAGGRTWNHVEPLVVSK